jgi:hypothetical protein
MLSCALMVCWFSVGCSYRDTSYEASLVRPKNVKWSSLSPSGRYLLESGEQTTAIYDSRTHMVLHAVPEAWDRPQKIEWDEESHFVKISGKHDVILPFMKQQ